MAIIQVKTNVAEVNRWITNDVIKKVPQAAKKALSQTIMQIQKAERMEVNRKFTIRKGQFIRNRIKITHFPKATDAGLYATLAIDDNVRGSPLLLSMFETGGTKRPSSGERVAIPITGGKARSSFGKKVAPSLRLDKLSLHKSNGRVMGARGTVILPSKGGNFTLFQRVKGDLVPLYIFKKNIRLKKRINFYDIANRLAYEQLPKLFNRYLRLYID